MRMNMCTRIQLDPSIAAYVAERIENYPNEAPHTPAGAAQCDFVRAYGALPLYVGWTESLGLRPDGELVRWSTDGEYEGVKPIESPVDCALAFLFGAERYAPLRMLTPPRPTEATECATCEGEGIIGAREFICECGGLGWLPRSLRDVGAEAVQ
jgi:hypothetical protein